MNYEQHPDLIEALCQRYVTGLLNGSARDRFERLLNDSTVYQNALAKWEDLLAPLAWSLEPVQPSELVLPRIMRQINKTSQASKLKSTEAKSTRWLNPALVAMLAVTGFGWWNSTQQEPEIITERVVETVIETVLDKAEIAVFTSSDGKAIWTASIYPETQLLNLNVQTAPDNAPDNDYQLWALTGDGTPVSLGLLPKSGQLELKLDSDMLTALESTATLAVSFEPLGGSPKAVPTGPVLMTAALLRPSS